MDGFAQGAFCVFIGEGHPEGVTDPSALGLSGVLVVHLPAFRQRHGLIPQVGVNDLRDGDGFERGRVPDDLHGRAQGIVDDEFFLNLHEASVTVAPPAYTGAMLDRDSQTLVISRPAVLLVTAVSVGLLTLSYVLGVQVGKQSAALRQPLSRGAGEDLQAMPAPLSDQLKNLQGLEQENAQKPNEAPNPATTTPASTTDAAKPSDAGAAAPDKESDKSDTKSEAKKPDAKADAKAKSDAKAKPEPARKEASKKPEPTKADHGKGDRWTAQLVSTTDAAEANRVANKAKAAGYSATVVKEKGTIKVRLAKPTARADMDAAITKLKAKGIHAFAVKAD